MVMPGEQGIRAHNGRKLLERASTQALSFGGQPDALVVRESETTRTELLPEYTILGLEIINHLALLLVDPSGESDDQKAQWVRNRNHSAEPIRAVLRRHPLAEAWHTQPQSNFRTLRPTPA
jgi:hypothetical protein